MAIIIPIPNPSNISPDLTLKAKGSAISININAENGKEIFKYKSG